MSKHYELDAVDRQLIALLRTNSRETAVSLARKLGLARTTIISRMARLEKAGVIAGYTVRLGRRFDERGLRAFVGVSISPKSGPIVLRVLARIPEIEELCAVSGDIDYMAVLRCESTARLDRVLDEIGAIDGVQRTTTAVVLASKIDRTIPV